MGYFDTKMTGDILQRINDHARIQSFLTGSSLNILFSMFNILIFGIVLALYSGTIFLIFIIGSLVYIIYVWLFLKKRAELDTSVLLSSLPIRVAWYNWLPVCRK